MLACTRIGAPHSVVFGGFSADALAGRIEDAECTVVITADGGYRKGATVPLKENADEAIGRTSSVQHCVVVKRTGDEVAWDEGRDHWYHDLVDDQPTDRRPGADGLRGPALPAVHLGHDRKAEGDHAHHRRLPRRREHHPSVHLRPQAGDRRVLVHGRHRLGDRALVHRLRAARELRRPGSSTRVPSTSPTRTDGRRSRPSTAPRSCTPPRPPSAR